MFEINKDKSNIIYFKRPSASWATLYFSCGDWNLDITSQYKYLRLLGKSCIKTTCYMTGENPVS